MNMSFLSLLQAAPSTTGSFLTTFLPFGLVILIFYFLIIRPQNKKQKETERMLSALKKGDKVVTAGGIHGVIQSVKESTVVVKVDESCKLEFNRSAVTNVLLPKGEKAEKAEKADKKLSLFGKSAAKPDAEVAAKADAKAAAKADEQPEGDAASTDNDSK